MNSPPASMFDFHRLARAKNGDAEASSGRKGALSRLVMVWEERIRSRRELARLAREAPRIIETMGWTMAEVDAELAKPFWRR